MDEYSQKGDCYQAAYQHMLRAGEEGKHAGMTVCHGVVTGKGVLANQSFGHAWIEVEEGESVIVRDLSNGHDITLPRDRYYQLGQIDPDSVYRYDIEKVIWWALMTRHYGPWEGDL